MMNYCYLVLNKYESAKLCALHACTPTRLTHHWYALYALARQCAFALINKHFTHLCLVLGCLVVLCCARYLLCFVCLLQLIPLPLPSPSLPPPLTPPSLSSLLFYHIKLFTRFFLSFFYLSHWLHCYLYSYFATTFSDYLPCFSFEINLTNIQFSHIQHSTHGQILQELLRFKHWNVF